MCLSCSHIVSAQHIAGAQKNPVHRWRNSGPERGRRDLSKVRAAESAQVPGSPAPLLLAKRPLPEHTRAQALCSRRTHFITELHLHFHTDYFKELEKVWGGGWGRDRCLSGARTPAGFPRPGRGVGWAGGAGSIRLFDLRAPALHVHTHCKPAAPHT